jgi:hypothetical protein
MTSAPENQLSITQVAVQETSALSKWEALAAEIAIATQDSESKSFDYRDKTGNKEARSWMYQLRLIKGSIERARKNAKAVHVQRGKAVDEKAKLLEAAVQGLIEPHETAIKAIEAQEQARIDEHKSVLVRIAGLAANVTSSSEAEKRLAELAEIDIDSLEEFAPAGKNLQSEITEKLKEALDALRIQEAERAELQQLRAEKAMTRERERVSPTRNQAAESPLADNELVAEVLAGSQEKTEQTQKQRLEGELVELLCQLGSYEGIASAIVNNKLHRAISVDWSLLDDGSEFDFHF